jgi:hypothetical protein
MKISSAMLKLLYMDRQTGITTLMDAFFATFLCKHANNRLNHQAYGPFFIIPRPLKIPLYFIWD